MLSEQDYPDCYLALETVKLILPQLHRAKSEGQITSFSILLRDGEDGTNIIPEITVVQPVERIYLELRVKPSEN